MKAAIGDIIQGFKLQEVRDVPEVHSQAYLFAHEKTGARLLKLQNEDDNRVFSISFRTPPADDTGLPHILEHSVLTGSRRFPTREPFVELLKGSLKTFLNAMTFPDKTMYPVASKNEADFFNLMNVYLDAVFSPNIYQGPETLMQEGWHYHMEDGNSPLTLSGVVYNEMKGVFSTPENILFSRIQKELYPDSPYGFESGGDPEAIPTLTYEQFLAFHKRYYHPGNSYIYLYGNGDTEKELRFIHEEYLNGFRREEIDSRITLQKPFTELKYAECAYPLSPEEEIEGKCFFGLCYSFGLSTDPVFYLGVEILKHMLLSTPAAPLKEALIKAGIGKDVMGVVENGILQPFTGVIAKYSEEDRLDDFQRIVRDTLTALVKGGLDSDLIEGSINHAEFQLREAEHAGIPKGLYHNMHLMDSWLYDASPFIHISYEATLDIIKREAGNRYFEGLIEKVWLSNPHGVLVILRPSRGLAEEREKRQRENLDSYRSSLSGEEIETLWENNRRLRERQESPDSEEALNTIPLLSLRDIRPEVQWQESVMGSEQGATLMHHPVATNKIAYLKLLFDSRVVRQDLIPYISILKGMLGKLNTRKSSYGDLSKRINIHTGGIGFHVENFTNKDDHREYHPFLTVNSKVLYDKLPRLMDLLQEILHDTLFDDPDRMLEVIREIKSRYEMNIVPQGHSLALRRALSFLSPSGHYEDLALGVAYYRFLVSLEKNFRDRFDEIRSHLYALYGNIFCRDRMLISLTAELEGERAFRESSAPFFGSLENQSCELQNYDFKPAPAREGLIVGQSQVQYVARAANYRDLGHVFSGRMHVLSSVIRLDYLWNQVRVQGGAYGAFMSLQRNGNVGLVSYRDPHLARTLRVYDAAGQYLKEFKASEREMTKYIIGTISDLDRHLTPAQKGEKALAIHLSGVTREELQREREEVLLARPNQITEYAAMLEDITHEEQLCVIGSEAKIREDERLFGSVENLMV